ncbi:helix-turn-helix domain-containing protein [Colwellia psychrerythraea]|uniref:Transcriptional regulator, AraC family n=1 Tax=Colwellia psychrerythraea TaxID=28229 RepID=A0A099KH42_COLPS|nr:helix-turn-helix domain-containing protein [Colwellia psychrerythraea]KGJ89631.1 transcriptional regulator, AraC family [Colwellia psychrerythraea]
MELQKVIHSNNQVRGMSTSDIDELAQFQVNKNRRYTQLYAGKLQGDYLEINLGKLQVFREKLNVGALIEATPASNFVPFAALLSNKDDSKFCGKHIEQNAILQATGGDWDVNFKNNLNVIAAVFDREMFACDIQLLTGQEIPSDWLVSKACLTEPLALTQYATGVNNIINLIQAKPEVVKTENSLRMINDTILKLAFNVLQETTPCNERRVNQSKRCEGVRQVMDYLHSYGDSVPTIPELCKIAKLSERNLQYGFKEYLGVTPIRYLRLLRLNGVRRDLLINQCDSNKVVDVALNWGFIELGRFASEYRQLFQELPSTTLRKAS